MMQTTEKGQHRFIESTAPYDITKVTYVINGKKYTQDTVAQMRPTDEIPLKSVNLARKRFGLEQLGAWET